MFNRPELSYAQRLKKATQRAFKENPTLGWRDAKERARTYLHDVLNVYPSTPAIMKAFKWMQKQKADAECIANTETL